MKHEKLNGHVLVPHQKDVAGVVRSQFRTKEYQSCITSCGSGTRPEKKKNRPFYVISLLGPCSDLDRWFQEMFFHLFIPSDPLQLSITFVPSPIPPPGVNLCHIPSPDILLRLPLVLSLVLLLHFIQSLLQRDFSSHTFSFRRVVSPTPPLPFTPPTIKPKHGL